MNEKLLTEDEFLPLVFEFAQLSLPSFREFSILLMDDALVYYRDEVEEKFYPSAEAWQSLRKLMDKLQVWQWQSTYTAPDILDGISWKLTIIYQDKEIICSGDNAFPENFALLLNKILSLVNKLKL